MSSTGGYRANEKWYFLVDMQRAQESGVCGENIMIGSSPHQNRAKVSIAGGRWFDIARVLWVSGRFQEHGY